MMLFTAFRIMEDGDVNATKECEDIDFEKRYNHNFNFSKTQ